MANRENVVRVINNYLTSLMKIRDAVEENDAETLRKVLVKVIDDREEWLAHRKENDWLNVDSPQTPLPTAGDVLGRLVWFGRPRSNPPKKRNK